MTRVRHLFISSGHNFFGHHGRPPGEHPIIEGDQNVFISGVELNALIGAEFGIQGVRFAGIEESKPCYWMDSVLGMGAEEWLRGRGGLRACILNDGVLRRDA